MNKKQQTVLSNLTGVFFISGLSALIYQICWQRLLFTGLGVDLTSITVIVSIFMAGLGVGAFFGGRIADKFPKNIITIFCLIELGVGFFGLFSYKLILSLQELLIYSNLFYTAIGSFLLLLFPTFLMGTTLPILTAFFHQYIDNIGESIGRLYFFNTLGAATGSLVTGFILFNYFTLSQTIYIAATLNIIIAFSIYFGYIGQKNEE